LSTKKTTTGYVELTNEVYALFVDAYGSAGKRALNYWKSVWEIASRPYTPVTIDSVVRTNFERANQLTSLTVDELRSAGRESAEVAEKLLAEGTKAQDTSLERLRGLLDTYASNLNYVKENASAQLDDFSKRLDGLEKRKVPLGGSK